MKTFYKESLKKKVVYRLRFSYQGKAYIVRPT